MNFQILHNNQSFNHSSSLFATIGTGSIVRTIVWSYGSWCTTISLSYKTKNQIKNILH